MIKRMLVFLFVLAHGAAAQQTTEPLTDDVIRTAIDLYNRAGTIRMTGDSRIAAGSEVVGDLAVLSGVLELDLAGLGLPVDRPFQVVDLLDDTRIRWQGPRIPVELDPRARSAYVLWLKP